MMSLSALLFVVSLMCSGLAIVTAIVPRTGNTLFQTLLALGGVSGLSAVVFFFTQKESVLVLPMVANFSLLAVTKVSAFFFAVVSVGLLLTSVYAIGYLPRYAGTFSASRVNLPTALFVLGMQSVLLATSPALFLLAWEIMSVSAYFLVIADKSEASLSAGFIYFVMTQLGFVALMAGFLLLANGAPFESWSFVANQVSNLSFLQRSIAFLLLCVGFGSKAGLVPFHQWLPQAHPQAPSHSSAMLSGVMLNVALYGFVSSLGLFPEIYPSWTVLVIVMGLLSAFFGSLHAAVEHDAKRLLAWSSIEHMGLLFSGIGALFALRTLPIDPFVIAAYSAISLFVVLHIVNHALFKIGLFLGVGAVASETHTRDLDELGGLARSWPVFSGVFLILSLAAAALPPFGAFVGEWAYVQGLAIGVAHLPPSAVVVSALMLSVLGITFGFAVFAAVKLFAFIFLGRARTDNAEHVAPLPILLTLSPAICAGLSIVMTLAAAPLLLSNVSSSELVFSTIQFAPGAGIGTSALLYEFFAVALFVFIVVRVIAGRFSTRITDTWDCGAPLTARMQYTSTGFASPIRFFFRILLLSQKNLIAVRVAESNPWITRKQLEWTTSSIWMRGLYDTLGSGFEYLASRMRTLQNGAVQLYLLFMLLALIATLIFVV